MKKVKKMAVGGVNAPRPSFQESMKSAGMNVPNLKTGDRSFSSTPTMGGLGRPPATYGPSTLPNAPIAGSGKFPIGGLQEKPGAVKPPNTPIKQRIGGFGPTQAPTMNAQQIMQKYGGLGKPMKKGGSVNGYAKGGSVSSASSRGDGIAKRGKTKGRIL